LDKRDDIEKDANTIRKKTKQKETAFPFFTPTPALERPKKETTARRKQRSEQNKKTMLSQKSNNKTTRKRSGNPQQFPDTVLSYISPFLDTL